MNLDDMKQIIETKERVLLDIESLLERTNEQLDNLKSVYRIAVFEKHGLTPNCKVTVTKELLAAIPSQQPYFLEQYAEKGVVIASIDIDKKTCRIETDERCPWTIGGVPLEIVKRAHKIYQEEN